MVLKLYCTSTAGGGSGVVALIMKEHNIPFEFVPVAFAPPEREHKTEKFMNTLHPFGQVPVLDDDGFILYESRAIARYLLAKYPSPSGLQLIPPSTDLKATARFEQAMSVETMNNFVAARIAEYEIILDGYERILSKTKYLAGDEFTLADLFHIQFTPLLTLGGYLGDVDLMHNEKRPNVARWWDELSGRQSWAELRAEGIKSTC
ncbi:hypothetical protein HMN09_00150100 [Mycena chlorophos]|uniref:glutathione transferase n=1 Tax=Mycena chlorophos TaxID=658473 RepID=A0A8H6TKR7_MYCCL|nr:hypothetical protein HMN09_00150100 [Mycena chlorophos]